MAEERLLGEMGRGTLVGERRAEGGRDGVRDGKGIPLRLLPPRLRRLPSEL